MRQNKNFECWIWCLIRAVPIPAVEPVVVPVVEETPTAFVSLGVPLRVPSMMVVAVSILQMLVATVLVRLDAKGVAKAVMRHVTAVTSVTPLTN